MDEAEAEHHQQQAKGDADLPAVEQSKALHDEDAEEGPTNHSSPASSPSLDEGREEADAALAPEGQGRAPDGEESSTAGLTREQEQLLSMLNDVVVENDEEEQEEEGKNEEEDGGKDDEGKEEEEEEKDLVDLVDLVEEEQGEEDMELEIEEKEKNSELVEEPRWAGLLPKKEVNDEGGDQSVPAPFFITKSENDGEEEQRNPDTQSARPGAASATTTPEHEWLAQLPSFVAPYAQRPSQRIEQQIEHLRIVEGVLSAVGQFEDALAYFHTQREELVDQLKQRKERFALFMANPQASAVALDEKWRQTFPWTESIRDTLSRVYQFRRFRPMQEEAINAALSGEDIFVLFATGAGKSLCYELPALYANGVTVVISPLKSLMNDQHNHLASRFTRKIAKPLHSDLSSAQRDEILQELRDGAATSRLQLKLCYVAPETFFQPYAQEVFKKLHDRGCLARFVVDEAHVLHEWEHFRPQYMNLSQLREQFPHVPITTTTATAPPPVIEKVCENLHLHDPIFFINNPPRRELSLSVIDRTHGEQQLIEWIKANWPDDCGIVYALTVGTVNLLCKALQNAGIAAGKYYQKEGNKDYIHDQWMADELKVIVATSAFGMGIDKPDVRYVVFYNLPQSMVQFHQGVGRAGRDGQRADGVIFWSYKDKREILNVQKSNGENQPDKATCETALNTLISYCQNTSVCRMGAMMEYLNTYTFSGEQALYQCTGPTDTEGICDNCRGYRESDEEEPGPAQDVAREIARVILRIAEFVESRADKEGDKGPISNVTMLVDIFCGSRKGSLKKAGFNATTDHGYAHRMGNKPKSEFVRDIVGQMLQKGILREDTWHGRAFISAGEHVARLGTTRFRTTVKATEDMARATSTSQKKTKKSTTTTASSSKSSKSDKGKEKVTNLDDFDEAEPKPEEERQEREKRKKKRKEEKERNKEKKYPKMKTTTAKKKGAHSASDLGLEADHSDGDEPRLKRRRTSEPAVGSGRGTTASSSSTATTRSPPRPRAAKVAASKALIKKEPEYPVEAVEDECTKRGEVYVKWEGYDHDQNTWERKKGFVATAPVPYREFLRRMQLEGRTITRDGPCECRLCREQHKLKPMTVKNENEKNDDNNKNENEKNEDKKEQKRNKNKKRRKRYDASSSDDSSASDKGDSDFYEQDDDSDALAEDRAWKSHNARAVRAEARTVLVVIDDDDDEDNDDNSDVGIKENSGGEGA